MQTPHRGQYFSVLWVASIDRIEFTLPPTPYQFRYFLVFHIDMLLWYRNYIPAGSGLVLTGNLDLCNKILKNVWPGYNENVNKTFIGSIMRSFSICTSSGEFTPMKQICT